MELYLEIKSDNILRVHGDRDNCYIYIPDKGTHNVDIPENVQGAEAANRMADEATGRKRPGEM